jgi:hypothetical protein
MVAYTFCQTRGPAMAARHFFPYGGLHLLPLGRPACQSQRERAQPFLAAQEGPTRPWLATLFASVPPASGSPQPRRQLLTVALLVAIGSGTARTARTAEPGQASAA